MKHDSKRKEENSLMINAETFSLRTRSFNSEEILVESQKRASERQLNHQRYQQRIFVWRLFEESVTESRVNESLNLIS